MAAIQTFSLEQEPIGIEEALAERAEAEMGTLHPSAVVRAMLVCPFTIWERLIEWSLGIISRRSRLQQ
jgi:hypothetical protein